MQQQGGAHSIEVELTYFFMDFGLPKFYFNHTDPAAIAKHILSLQAAKQLARLSEKPFDIQLNLASAHSAFFATTSNISTAAGHPKRLGANNDTCQVEETNKEKKKREQSRKILLLVLPCASLFIILRFLIIDGFLDKQRSGCVAGAPH